MRTVRAETAIGFSTFAAFYESTAENDREFLAEEDIERFPPAACGMANGAGGWIVFGASLDEERETPVVTGLRNLPALRERLSLEFSRGETFSAPLAASFFVLNEPAPLLIVAVHPAEWHDRPVSVGGDYALGVYRRVEGENLISGRRAKFRLGLDALERLRSDRPARGVGLSDLDGESVAAFRAAVTERRPSWASMSDEAFLSRALVLSGGAVTQAGRLLLGKEGAGVRIEFHVELEVHNLWKAYALLPRLTQSFSEPCAAAFEECYVNALLHADYDAGGVNVTLSGSPLSALIKNPGLPRTWKNGGSACRNFRLLKMFQLFGAARGEGRGLGVIRRYQPDFELEEDGLELTTSASLTLEPKAGPETLVSGG